MAYVDGFVLAVPSARKDEYQAHCQTFGKMIVEYGAIKVVECWGNDVPQGEITSFPMAVKAEEDETVCFSWIYWQDKAARDTGMQKLMQDPRMQEEGLEMPYDGKRMIFGGFDVLTEIE